MSTGGLQSTVVSGGRLLSGGRDHGLVDVRLEGGRIATVARACPGGAVRVDARGLTVMPGLVDLHLHGAGGHDVTAGDAALDGVARALAMRGTTAFLATSATMAATPTAQFVEAVARCCGARPGGAELLGSHLEGPWLNPHHGGAHDRSLLRSPRLEEVADLLERGRGSVRRVTLAPELGGASEAIAMLAEHGVGASAGHSAAGVDAATDALDSGMTVTHLFNGMVQMHHRDPGLPGAALAHPRAVCELIADGVHVHPTVLRLAAAALGPERTLLVSDGLPVMGAPGPGIEWMGMTITSDGRAGRLPGGALAGSATDLLSAVQVLATAARLDIPTALLAATAVPAAVAGVADRKGQVAPGYDADLVLVDDRWRVVATWCRGELVWHTTDGWQERAEAV